jgi:hypothetical protein
MNSLGPTGVAEGDDSGDLLVVEVDGLLLDVVSALLRLPLFVLAGNGDVDARL